MPLQTDNLVVVLLYDLTHKRLWFHNYAWSDFDYDLGILYNCARNDAKKYLDSLDENHKPVGTKFRLEMKFLVEDKSK